MVFVGSAICQAILSLSIILLFTSNGIVWAESIRKKEQRILNEILDRSTYDPKIRPSGANDTGPVLVKVNLYVRSITGIDDVTMEYSTQLTFRQQWEDERLKFNDWQGKIKYLTLNNAQRVWVPDLFFTNEKNGFFHDIVTPNIFFRIFPNGNVLYSLRVSLTLACPMNLRLYPFDKQTCSMKIASYGWTTDDLMLLWKKGDPIQVTKNLHLPRFTLEKFSTDYCNSKTNTGEYSCLKLDLMYKREFSYYLTQIYIPCCMLVIVSWMSFWFDPNQVLARVFLEITTLLTMAIQTSGINESLPPVSYTKAIDVWTGVCITFVFGALLEFALVNYIYRSDMNRENVNNQQRKWKQEDASMQEAASSSGHADQHPDHLEDGATAIVMKPLTGNMSPTPQPQPAFHCYRWWISKFPSLSKRIDIISRIAFPTGFALFNVVYWCTYL